MAIALASPLGAGRILDPARHAGAAARWYTPQPGNWLSTRDGWQAPRRWFVRASSDQPRWIHDRSGEPTRTVSFGLDGQQRIEIAEQGAATEFSFSRMADVGPFEREVEVSITFPDDINPLFPPPAPEEAKNRPRHAPIPRDPRVPRSPSHNRLMADQCYRRDLGFKSDMPYIHGLYRDRSIPAGRWEDWDGILLTYTEQLSLERRTEQSQQVMNTIRHVMSRRAARRGIAPGELYKAGADQSTGIVRLQASDADYDAVRRVVRYPNLLRRERASRATISTSERDYLMERIGVIRDDPRLRAAGVRIGRYSGNDTEVTVYITPFTFANGRVVRRVIGSGHISVVDGRDEEAAEACLDEILKASEEDAIRYWE